MANDDNYPAQSGRRRFVRGVVGSAGLAAAGITGTVSVDALTSPSGSGGGTVEFFGVENTDGPAPRAMPQIPIEIDSDGALKGIYPSVEEVEQKGETVTIAEEELGGTTYSAEWFQYCGLQGYEGIQPSYDGDDYFRYTSGYDWIEDQGLADSKMKVEHFEDFAGWGNGIGDAGIGKPGTGTWRSEDTENSLPIQVLRSERVNDLAGTAGNWFDASTAQGFVAWMNKCTHFCCVPGFKTTEQSATFGAANDIYCPCHQSVYDPFSIVKRAFVAFPRPEEG